MTPLNCEQQKIVLAYRQQVSDWIVSRYPMQTDRRDEMMATAFLAIVEAVAGFQCGSEAERDRYVWAAIHQSRRDAWKDEKKHKHKPADLDAMPTQERPDNQALIEREEAAEEVLIHTANELSSADKIALAMHSIGYTSDQIAEELQKPARTIRHRIKTARDAFKELFRENS